MKGMAKMVAILSPGLLRVRVAMMAGTEQPKPSIMGRKAALDM